MAHAIVFDLPNHPEPLFAEAVRYQDETIPAIAPSLRDAARFATEDEAERFLADHYGPKFREYGVVVELDPAGLILIEDDEVAA